ncbi:MAG: hypothetical protein IAE64_07410 [Flavobacteriales bacterium]|nr:hypothetical protein [Flavobacteriales bacterium]
MNTSAQIAVNSKITPNLYQQLRDELDAWLGMTIQYKIVEMPIIISREFASLLEESAVSIAVQAAGTEPSKPLFCVVDFAVCTADDGTFIPKLIELQGFPSLYCYQLLLAETYSRVYDLHGFDPLLSGLDRETYLDYLSKAVYADADPSATFLVEIDPSLQKTRPDFIAFEKLIGLKTINIRDITRNGRSLFTTIDGRTTKIDRIFNRAILDEMDDLGVELNFSWNDDLDVAWAGHPSWYFKISKQTLPYLHHPSVPRTVFVSDLSSIPANLNDYVLKPLFSFAGKGVTVGPDSSHIEQIPDHDRSKWIIQERVRYADCVPTPTGTNKVEIRIMLIWLPEAEKPLPVITLARTGRGDLMGARYNTMPWTGSGTCLTK